MTHEISSAQLTRQYHDDQKTVMELAAYRTVDRHRAIPAALVHWIELHGLLKEFQQDVADVGREHGLDEHVLENICGPKGDWR